MCFAIRRFIAAPPTFVSHITHFFSSIDADSDTARRTCFLAEPVNGTLFIEENNIIDFGGCRGKWTCKKDNSQILQIVQAGTVVIIYFLLQC